MNIYKYLAAVKFDTGIYTQLCDLLHAYLLLAIFLNQTFIDLFFLITKVYQFENKCMSLYTFFGYL